MKAEILLFSVDPVTRARIENVVKPMLIGVREVDKKDHGKKLGEICGVPAPAAGEMPEGGEAVPVSAPMMLFAAIPDSLLFIILDKLKENGVRIPHKAAVTPTNLGWTPEELFGEISREIASFAARKNNG
jgi:hypothetical protein